jgi:hypothetical protein
MRLRRFKGTILVGVLIIAPFIVDGCIGGSPPGADGEQGGGGTHLLGLEDSPSASGSDRGGLRVMHDTESGGSRMGGDSRLGGNSVHGLETRGADTAGSGLGNSEKGISF